MACSLRGRGNDWASGIKERIKLTRATCWWYSIFSILLIFLLKRGKK